MCNVLFRVAQQFSDYIYFFDFGSEILYLSALGSKLQQFAKNNVYILKYTVSER